MITDRIELLERLDADYTEAISQAAAKKAEFKLAEARAYMVAGGTVKERESQALIDCQDQFADHYEAEALERALRVAIDINLAALQAEVHLSARDVRIADSAAPHTT